MNVSVGPRKLLWPILIGLLSVFSISSRFVMTELSSLSTIYMVVIPFILLVLHVSYYEDWHFKIGVAIENLWSNINKNQTQYQASPYLVVITYWECMFVVSFIKYTCPPNCVHFWVYSSWLNLEKWSNPFLFFFEHVFIIFVVWSSPNYTPIENKCPIKKKKLNNTHLPYLDHWHG
jgi:hypothetical protein